ncbi:hypothetical protein E2C01_034852 [Portunus trituberculatus]|uniref:Uncharacterized protein n=1 Tax=Portunus trituberculatus TaxID=210409 RepID=A0A5B7F9V7_PORTR|nr:hypothetical protein [Portunus trituberculatus]
MTLMQSCERSDTWRGRGGDWSSRDARLRRRHCAPTNSLLPRLPPSCPRSPAMHLVEDGGEGCSAELGGFVARSSIVVYYEASRGAGSLCHRCLGQVSLSHGS